MHLRIASVVNLVHMLAGTGVCHLLSSWTSRGIQWQLREKNRTSRLTHDSEPSEHRVFVSRRNEYRLPGHRRPYHELKHLLGGQAIIQKFESPLNSIELDLGNGFYLSSANLQALMTSRWYSPCGMAPWKGSRRSWFTGRWPGASSLRCSRRYAILSVGATGQKNSRCPL